MLTIAHVCIIAPHRTGLYGTARDIVKAERSLDVDARLVDPLRPQKGKVHDVPVDGHQWACKADVWVSHSGVFPHLAPQGKPVIHILHGRPYSSYLLGLMGKATVYDFLLRQVTDPDFKAFVTLWAEFLPYWRHLIPSEKLHAANPPVDLEAWSPEGPDGYKFGGKGGAINVVVTDQWREDKNPCESIHAFSLFAEKVKGAKLHVYGAPVKNKGFAAILKPLAQRGVLGEVKGFVSGLENVYRAADALVTPHSIATRTVREALACGCQVVMAPGNPYSKYSAHPDDIEAVARCLDAAVGERKVEPDKRRAVNRKAAETHFNPRDTATTLIALAERCAREAADGGSN